MSVQIFTFGCGQTFANGFVRIEAETDQRCREIMDSTFGSRWSMQYPEETMHELKAKYGMFEMCHIRENEDGQCIAITTNNIFVSQ